MTSLERLALGVLLPAFPGTTLAPDVAPLFDAGLGGLCLFGSNTAGGPEAVAALTASVRDIRAGVVVAVDEEGGDVTRLHARETSPVLGAAALGAADELSLTRRTGRFVGTELAGVGVTLDLGPVADVNSRPENPVIGTRSFGAEPALVAAHAAAWLTGLQEAGVAACVKHFPGHGDTSGDSHLELPTIDVAEKTLAERELVPFAAAVDAGVAAVMTSHIVVPVLDPGRPATLSPIVLGVLRERLGFGGVIVTDALDMAGASAGRGVPEAAVLSLVAGADLLCLGADKDVALVRAVQGAVVEAVRSGRLAEERLVDAAARAGSLARPVPPAPLLADADAATHQLAGARRATTVQGRLPALQGALVVSVQTGANIAVGDVPWGLRPDLSLPPEPAALALVPSGVPVIVQVRDAHRHPGVVGLLAEVADQGRATVVVEWGWPGPYDDRLPRILTHGCSRPGVAVVTELLREAGWSR